MAIRTNDEAVRAIIENCSSISMTPFMHAANSLVDKIDTYDTEGVLSNSDLKLIETWLAAHFYGVRDAQFQSKSTQGASGGFQGQTGKFLELTWWGQQAMLLDVSGYLRNLNDGKVNMLPQLLWLGTAPSQVTNQADYQ